MHCSSCVCARGILSFATDPSPRVVLSSLKPCGRSPAAERPAQAPWPGPHLDLRSVLNGQERHSWTSALRQGRDSRQEEAFCCLQVKAEPSSSSPCTCRSRVQPPLSVGPGLLSQCLSVCSICLPGGWRSALGDSAHNLGRVECCGRLVRPYSQLQPCHGRHAPFKLHSGLLSLLCRPVLGCS